MKFLRNHIAMLSGALLWCVVFALFATVLSHVLIYGEQHRLFLYSLDYIAEEAHFDGWRKPVADFILQFAYIPTLGAAVMALVLTAIYALTVRALTLLTGAVNWLTIGLSMIAPCWLTASMATIEVRFEPVVTALAIAFAFWLVALTVHIAVGPLRRRERQAVTPRGFWMAAIVALLLCGGCIGLALGHYYNPMERDVVLIEEEYINGDDDAVLARADRYLSKGGQLVHVIPFFRNLSLARKGMLAEHVNDYPNPFGVKALYVAWDGHVLKREYGYHLYEWLGHINEAQRWQFESMTSYGETGRNLYDMARYNIVNGRDAVARRNIGKLRKSLFYRDKATRLLDYVGTGAVPGTKDFFAAIPDSVGRFCFNDLIQETGYMNTVAPGDRDVQEMMLVASALGHDLNRMMSGLKIFGRLDLSREPKLYREAAAMFAYHNPGGWWRDAGFIIPQDDLDRYRRFVQTRDRGDRLSLKSNFGNTYWYYFFNYSPDRPGARQQQQSGNRVQTS